MPPYKRKLMSESAWQSSKRSAPYSKKAAVVRMRPNQKSKMLSILKGHTETTATVQRFNNALIGTAAQSFCLTSSATVATAGEATGLLGFDEDRAMINYIDVHGYVNVNGAALDGTSSRPSAVRLLIVRYTAPSAPDGSGNLPGVTNVLESDDLEAFDIAPDKRGSKFTILSDKRWTIPANGTWIPAQTSGSGTAALPCGRVDFSYRVKVNKPIQFVLPGNPNVGSTSFAAGHYDSSTEFGRVNNGLIVGYIMAEEAQFTARANIRTRVNFTA